MKSTHAANKAALFSKGGAGAQAPPPRSTFTTAAPLANAEKEPKRLNFEKLKEAEDWRGKATKALKTSVFGNWKPDYMAAGQYFDRAASVFKAAGADEQAKGMYTRAAECNEKVQLYAAAATSYKNAANIMKDEEPEEAARIFAKEAEMWFTNGDPGRAADSYMRAAVLMEDSSPEGAIDYAMQAMEQLYPEGGEPLELAKAPLASDNFTKALNLCLTYDRVAEAIRVVDKAAAMLAVQNLESSLFKMFVTQTILQLYQGDVVAAEKLFMESHIQNNNYIRSSECEVEEELVHAAKAMDPDKLQAALSKIHRAYLDNNVVRFAKRLTIDRISGMGDFDDDSTPRSGRPSSPPTASSPFARKPKGAEPEAEIEIDPEMTLSEEEKARIRAHPFGKTSNPPAPAPTRAPAPASAPLPPPRQAPAPPAAPANPFDEDEGSEEGRVGVSPGHAGLMDLSDLQAGLEGGDDDEDLDAMIAAAREAAMSEVDAPEGLPPAPSTRRAAAPEETGPPPPSANEDDDEDFDLR